MTDHLMSIALSGHAEIGTVDTMTGATGTVTAKCGGMIIVAAETGIETTAGVTIGVREPIGRIVETVALDGMAGSGCPTGRVYEEREPATREGTASLPVFSGAKTGETLMLNWAYCLQGICWWTRTSSSSNASDTIGDFALFMLRSARFQICETCAVQSECRLRVCYTNPLGDQTRVAITRSGLDFPPCPSPPKIYYFD